MLHTLYFRPPQPLLYIYIIKHFKNLDKRKFQEELENIDWNLPLAVYCNYPNISLDIFLKSVNSILDRHVPLIGVTKKKSHG